MDLLEIVRSQVSSLPAGEHEVGLRSVLRHIETAYRHLARGQSDGDDSAYTDAIYRSNQAFEGSIKEAYRVLADKDPHKTTPYNIELYLQKNNLFKPRVLSQFTNYRTEWRNPSTHDYNLDFDEDEAFLAIVSVSAFSKMLVDQIVEKFAFEQTQKDVARDGLTADSKTPDKSLIEYMKDEFLSFLSNYAPHRLSNESISEAQILGSLGGYISSKDNNIHVNTNMPIDENERSLRIDMIISRGDERVIVELKRGLQRASLENGRRHLETALLRSGIKAGILLIHGATSSAYQDYHYDLPNGIEIKVIAPVENE